ncbi:O-methyltransferase [Luedemannella flava]|uniref:O-methyltransferase n=2 Tax=Luedemannella flava TaxID=349316 RepID=A0ABP4YII9_9ACTN
MRWSSRCRPRRFGITAVTHDPPSPSTHGFVEAYAALTPALRAAMAAAREVGVVALPAGAGAALRLLAAVIQARTVVEIGTGTGVSGLWLLGGMRADGVLTTIDAEQEHQRLARRAFAMAGHAPGRARIITGRALDVLPRLADGGYDLVFVDGPVSDYAACVVAARRLLRAGGLLVLNRMFGVNGRVVDPTARDPDTVALREIARQARDSEEWLPALLPSGEGLLCLMRR